MHRKRSRGRRLTDEERSEKRAAERKLMAEAVQSLRSSEGWQRWLSLRRHFHTYSFANQLLIAFQMPHATRVAGFHDWKKIGYAVRKGEHGIRIWAPCKPSKKRMKKWREEGADPHARPRVFFRMVSVFDRSQVDPIPDFPEPVDLDPPLVPIEGDGLAHFLLPLQAFSGSIAFGFEVEPTPSGVDGYCDLKESRIVVRPLAEDFSPNAQVSTAVHEVSHAIVSLEDADDRPQLSRAEEEVVVECVAYSVCSTLGLDTSASATTYMATWGDGSEIERYGQLIDTLATRIEDALLGDADAEPREEAVAAAA
ncbi:MAG: ArdC family protein [Solirubrobacterales bacterium]